MKLLFNVSVVILFFIASSMAFSDDKLRLETTFIKGNKEMPQVIYIVPWKDMKNEVRKEQTLVLHSLFGDLFDPVYIDVQKTQ